MVSIVAAHLFAQSPTPATPSSIAPSATGIPSKSPAISSPSPAATPSAQELVDSLGRPDLQAVITLLKSNFTNTDAITETELNRATLEGLMVRLPRGVMLFPNKESARAEAPSAFYNEVLGGHIGYLRSSEGTNDFAMAADFAKRFCPKGKTLFTLRKPAARQDRVFSSDRGPAFQGLIMVLADGDTSGAAEALAAALRFYDKALVIGQPTRGRAAEYSDLSLPGGKILRVAVAEMVSPDGRSLFPEGTKPDLPVEMAMADKRQIFQASGEKGMGPFVYEAGRPHLNEAALLAGTNPEIEAAEAAQQSRKRSGLPEKPPTHDPVLQRALDVVTSLEVYQKR